MVSSLPRVCEPFAERGGQKVLDIAAALQIGQEVLAVIFGVLVPDLAFAVFCAEVTQEFTPKRTCPDQRSPQSAYRYDRQENMGTIGEMRIPRNN